MIKSDEGFDINFDDGERKFIDLEFDNGETGEFMVIDIIEVGKREYIILTSEEEFDKGEITDLLYYRYSEDANGDPILDMIESESEFNKVTKAFEAELEEIEYDQMADEMDD